MPTQTALDRKYLRIALLSGLESSKDPNRKVGACVVSSDGKSLSLGYNGLARGVPDTEENWARPLKYELVVHAEINAVINAPFDTTGATVYAAPLKLCHRCVPVMINAGIRRMVWYDDGIPYINDYASLMKHYEPLIEMTCYTLDDVAQSIIDLYGHRHDGYKNT